MTDTDRDKYCVQRIVDFYERHQVDLADYFLAAWRYQHRAALGQPANRPRRRGRRESQLSAKYLALVWSLLTDRELPVGPLAVLRHAVAGAAAADARPDGARRRAASSMRDLVVRLRKQLQPPSRRSCSVSGISAGSQPFVLWRNRQLAARQHADTPATWRPTRRSCAAC